MDYMMNNFCEMVRKEMITRAEAEALLGGMCDDYGTCAVGQWLTSNAPDVSRWLDEVAA